MWGIRSGWAKHEWCGFYGQLIFIGTGMSNQENTPPPSDDELKSYTSHDKDDRIEVASIECPIRDSNESSLRTSWRKIKTRQR